MYSPLSHWGCLAGGKRVGIVGIGGLGQMGVSLVIVVMMMMVVMVQSIFLSIFFLHIKSGFYTWSQSKILLLSPLIIGSNIDILRQLRPLTANYLAIFKVISTTIYIFNKKPKLCAKHVLTVRE